MLGLLPFDVDHVALLGLSLTGGGNNQTITANSGDYKNSNDGDEQDWSWEVEVIVAERVSGTFVSADVLPLRGLSTFPANLTMAGIRGLNLLAASSHSQSSSSSDYRVPSFSQSQSTRQVPQTNTTSQQQQSSQLQVPQPQPSQWRLRAMESQRGGDRGLAPLLLVTAPCDLILCRVRDVNDRVRAALELKDLKVAAETAARDRAALRVYPFADLLQAYLSQLMEAGELETAASEAARLIQHDSVLWESWLYRFLQAGRLDALVPHLPVDRPRLERYLYDEALDDLADRHPSMLLSTVKLWTSIGSNNGNSPSPTIPCFDVPGLLERIKRRLASTAPSTSNIGNAGEQRAKEEKGDGDEDHNRAIDEDQHDSRSNSKDKDRKRLSVTQLLETAAYLHLLRREHEEALSCYLSMPLPPSSSDHGYGLDQDLLLPPSTSSLGNSSSQQGGYEHRQVFDLIEKPALQQQQQPSSSTSSNKESSSSSLFRLVESKIANLVRLSRPLAARLLLNHVDGRLPIRSVAAQIQRASDDSLLLWYLHQLFTDTTALEIYRDPSQFADLHLCQLRLYIKRLLLLSASVPNTAVASKSKKQQAAVDIAEKQLLSFVREGLVPDQVALQELEQQAAAANLLGDSQQQTTDIVAGVDSGDTVSSRPSPLLHQERVLLLARLGRSQQALQLLMGEVGSAAASLAFITGRSSVDEQRSLWEDLTAYALPQPSFLGELLDSLGSAACLGLDAASLLRRLPEHYTHLPQLRSRIARALTELRGQEALLRQGRSLLAEDALATLLLKNQRQRRALKVMPTAASSLAAGSGSSLHQQQGSDRCLLCRRPLVVLTSEAQAMTAMGITVTSSDYSNTAPVLSLSSLSSTASLMGCGWTQQQLWGAACFLQQQQSSKGMDEQHASSTNNAGSLQGIVFISGKVAAHHSCFDVVRRLQLQSPPLQQSSQTTEAVTAGLESVSASASASHRHGRRLAQPPIR